MNSIVERPVAAAQAQMRVFAGESENARQLESVSGQLSRYQPVVEVGGVDAAITYCRQNRSPDLLVVDVSAEADAFAALDRLADHCEAHCRVLVVGSRNEIGFYQSMMALGISDYLPLPLDADRYQHAVQIAMGDKVHRTVRLGKQVAIMGSRGGVGVTTLAANLSWALAHELNINTAVIDLDLQHGDLDLLLGFTASERLAQVMDTPLNENDLTPLERAGDTLAERLTAFKSRGMRAMADGAKNCLEMLCQRYNRVVIDMPRLGPQPFALLQQADIRVLVTEPGLSSLRETAETLQLLGPDQPGHRTLVVLNHVRSEKHQLVSPLQIEQTLRRKPDFILPWQPDQAVSAQDLGTPVVAGNSRLSQQIRLLARNLIGHQSEAPRKRSLAGLLERLNVRS